MQISVRLTRKRVAMLTMVIAIAATASVGWAAIGDGGTVKGCVAANGTIDAIDPLTQGCKDRQTPVEWYTKSGADATFLGAAAKAADSDKLDGQDSTAFLGAGAKAADANNLDGIDSTGFVNGGGSYKRYWENATIPAGQEVTLLALGNVSVVGLCTASSVQLELRHPFGGWDGTITNVAQESGGAPTISITRLAGVTPASAAAAVLKADILAHSFAGQTLIDARVFGFIVGGFNTCKFTAAGVLSHD
jgi:hypothetical protein